METAARGEKHPAPKSQHRQRGGWSQQPGGSGQGPAPAHSRQRMRKALIFSFIAVQWQLDRQQIKKMKAWVSHCFGEHWFRS